jgi:hypothetical protein
MYQLWRIRGCAGRRTAAAGLALLTDAEAASLVVNCRCRGNASGTSAEFFRLGVLWVHQEWFSALQGSASSHASRHCV